MSRLVNIILDEELRFVVLEDVHTSEIVDVGHWIDVGDGCRALQLRVLDLRNRNGDEGICPCCMQRIPPPQPDLTWKKSLP